MTDWYVSGLNNKQLRKNQIYSLWINEIIEQWKFQHKITLAVDNECRRFEMIFYSVYDERFVYAKKSGKNFGDKTIDPC